MTEAMAANTPNGANFITKSVSFSMMATSSSMKRTVVAVASRGSAAMAKPKNSENTRICRMALVDIACAMLVGNTLRDEVRQVQRRGLEVRRRRRVGQRQAERGARAAAG